MEELLQRLLRAAEACIERNDFPKAATLVNSVKTRFPNEPEAERISLALSILECSGKAKGGLTDFFDVLKIDKSSPVNSSAIRQSFRKLSLQLHPDKHSSPAATRAFLVAKEACHCLSNDTARELHIQALSTGQAEIASSHLLLVKCHKCGAAFQVDKTMHQELDCPFCNEKLRIGGGVDGERKGGVSQDNANNSSSSFAGGGGGGGGGGNNHSSFSHNNNGGGEGTFNPYYNGSSNNQHQQPQQPQQQSYRSMQTAAARPASAAAQEPYLPPAASLYDYSPSAYQSRYFNAPEPQPKQRSSSSAAAAATTTTTTATTATTAGSSLSSSFGDSSSLFGPKLSFASLGRGKLQPKTAPPPRKRAPRSAGGGGGGGGRGKNASSSAGAEGQVIPPAEHQTVATTTTNSAAATGSSRKRKVSSSTGSSGNNSSSTRSAKLEQAAKGTIQIDTYFGGKGVKRPTTATTMESNNNNNNNNSNQTATFPSNESRNGGNNFENEDFDDDFIPFPSRGGKR